MSGLKRISSVLMNMVGWTIYRALMFFLYLKTHTDDKDKVSGAEYVAVFCFSAHFTEACSRFHFYFRGKPTVLLTLKQPLTVCF